VVALRSFGLLVTVSATRNVGIKVKDRSRLSEGEGGGGLLVGGGGGGGGWGCGGLFTEREPKTCLFAAYIFLARRAVGGSVKERRLREKVPI